MSRATLLFALAVSLTTRSSDGQVAAVTQAGPCAPLSTGCDRPCGQATTWRDDVIGTDLRRLQVDLGEFQSPVARVVSYPTYSTYITAVPHFLALWHRPFWWWVGVYSPMGDSVDSYAAQSACLGGPVQRAAVAFAYVPSAVPAGTQLYVQCAYVQMDAAGVVVGLSASDAYLIRF